MFNQAGGTAGVSDCWNHLPAFPGRNGQKTVDLGTVAAPIKQSLAPVYDEPIHSGPFLDETVCLMHQTGKKNVRHQGTDRLIAWPIKDAAFVCRRSMACAARVRQIDKRRKRWW